MTEKREIKNEIGWVTLLQDDPDTWPTGRERFEAIFEPGVLIPSARWYRHAFCSRIGVDTVFSLLLEKTYPLKKIQCWRYAPIERKK